MSKVPVSEAREELSEIINRVSYGGERIVLQRRGKNVVAVISIEDLNLLEALEDKIDLEEAKKALKETERDGSIPWSQVKKELGL